MVSDVGDEGRIATFSNDFVKEGQNKYLAGEVDLDGLDANVLGTRSHLAKIIKYAYFKQNRRREWEMKREQELGDNGWRGGFVKTQVESTRER